MIAVSEAWKAAQSRTLAPEGFVELTCYIPELKDALVYTKKDLISFTHQQTGSLVSGELPKNHIEFALDNSDGKWNPSNPTGLERYLSERQKIKLRYGLNVDGVIEWIPGGVFYLSEWHTPANGIEASFVARDLLEYMIDHPYTGAVTGTLYEIAERAIAEAGIPSDAVVSICDELKNYSVGAIEYNGKESVAEILQKCANAASCIMHQDREGVLRIERLLYESTGFVFPRAISYAFPEIEFSRPLKAVTVSYQGDGKATFIYGVSGETQTLTNEFVSSDTQAAEVAKWVCDSLRTRKKISGEVRGDPRLDVFDVVDVENKYGTVHGVVLTDIKYNFTGAFRAAYTGYIRGSGAAVTIYSGEIFTGEVV
jgi:hypothetical protein